MQVVPCWHSGVCAARRSERHRVACEVGRSGGAAAGGEDALCLLQGGRRPGGRRQPLAGAAGVVGGPEALRGRRRLLAGAAQHARAQGAALVAEGAVRLNAVLQLPAEDGPTAALRLVQRPPRRRLPGPGAAPGGRAPEGACQAFHAHLLPLAVRKQCGSAVHGQAAALRGLVQLLQRALRQLPPARRRPGAAVPHAHRRGQATARIRHLETLHHSGLPGGQAWKAAAGRRSGCLSERQPGRDLCGEALESQEFTP
mmetsp:Transcript_62265/g.181900  ORF Transcript_62265/g.181900 Transcript_62265/m.181900 type:complete len:256 (+) Transcript_62265:400-1167(+)